MQLFSYKWTITFHIHEAESNREGQFHITMTTKWIPRGKQGRFAMSLSDGALMAMMDGNRNRFRVAEFSKFVSNFARCMIKHVLYWYYVFIMFFCVYVEALNVCLNLEVALFLNCDVIEQSNQNFMERFNHALGKWSIHFGWNL